MKSLRERLVQDESYERLLVARHAGQGFCSTVVGELIQIKLEGKLASSPFSPEGVISIGSQQNIDAIPTYSHGHRLHLPSSDMYELDEWTLLSYVLEIADVVKVPTASGSGQVPSNLLGIREYEQTELQRLNSTVFSRIDSSSSLWLPEFESERHYFAAHTPDEKRLVEALQATVMPI